MSADPNIGFVAAAYALGFLVLGGMIASVVTDYRRLKRELSKFPPRSDARASD